jgi:AraC-like DNA-binding protein
MENTIYEILSAPRNFRRKDISAEVFSMDEGDIVIFINTDEGEAIDGDSFYIELFYKIQEYCKRYLGIEVSATISPILTGIKDLRKTLDICGNTLNQRTSAAIFLPYNGGQRNEIAIIKNFLSSHIGEKFGVQEAASLVCMSENYFSHFFKKETGISFIDYVNHFRMEKAVELLEKSNQKIIAVAGQVGIDNPNYFSVLFKKIMGCSPQEFREKLKIVEK